MKVVLVVPLFPPRWEAGIEIATQNIAKYGQEKCEEKFSNELQFEKLSLILNGLS